MFVFLVPATSPYMTVGGPEVCLGPGVCTGHGLPAGIAVVQFPDAKEKRAWGPAHPGAPAIDEPKVCPGPGICPGSTVCPHCRATQGSQEPGALQALKDPADRRSQEPSAFQPGAGAQTFRLSEMDEQLLHEMKSLVFLDLEKIREEMRSKKLGSYDERDILERLSAIWEALRILKHNEEAIAIKIARQDAIVKKIPAKIIDKLRKIFSGISEKLI